MKKHIQISRVVLEDLYINKGLPLKVVAKELGISEPTVRKRFRSHGLVLRPHGSWAIKYRKTPFDGDDEERAYILGFRVGDLNVYVPSEKSNIIVARTTSTQIAQINLMRLLFKRYGGINISGKNAAKNIICYLDKSFSFLLINKPYQVESWIKDTPQNSLAFIAGYIDAEANFIINQGRARFKIDSYDEDVLHWLHAWLLSNGVQSKLRLLAKRGQPHYSGGYWNNDIWRLNVNAANSLFNLCQWLVPYLRHEKRIDDVNKCLKNIMIRKSNGTI